MWCHLTWMGFRLKAGMTVVQRSPTAGIHGVGSLRWVPVYTGTTAGGGAPHTVGATARPHRHSRDGGNPRRGSLRWVPVSTGTTAGDGAPTSLPRRRESTSWVPSPRERAGAPTSAGIHGVGRQGWVPVSTGTTVGGGAPHTVGDGAPTSSFPRRRESTAGGARDGFPSTGTTVGGGGTPHGRAAARPHRHSRDGGNPRRGEPAMGSRLHGNDGVIGDGGNPRRGGEAMGSRLHGNDGGRRRTVGRRRAHIVIPATAGIHGGGRQAMGSRLHGNDGSTHMVIPATAGIHGVGACDGFPSPRERR